MADETRASAASQAADDALLLAERAAVGDTFRAVDNALRLLGAVPLPKRSAAYTAALEVITEGVAASNRNAEGVGCPAASAKLDAALLESFCAGGTLTGVFEEIANRSAVESGRASAQRCGCGASAFTYIRRPVIANGFATHQTVCRRCGDIESRTAHGCDLRVHCPRDVQAGQTVEVSLTWRPRITAVHRLGLGLRQGFAATVSDNHQRKQGRSGELQEHHWSVTVPKGSSQEAQYLLPFVVAEGEMAAARHHIRVWADPAPE